MYDTALISRQNAVMFYRGANGEKWQTMGWNMVRMATHCEEYFNPLEYVGLNTVFDALFSSIQP